MRAPSGSLSVPTSNSKFNAAAGSERGGQAGRHWVARHEEDAGSLIRDMRAVYVQRYCGAGAVESDVNHFRALSQQQGDTDTECVIV